LDIQNLKAVGTAVVFAAGISGPGYFTNKKSTSKMAPLILNFGYVSMAQHLL
jgi:hypothetical protein